MFKSYTFIKRTFVHRYNSAVKAELISLNELAVQECIQSRNSRFSHLHQLNGCSLQLRTRLQEVSAVYPQPCSVQTDYCSSGRSGESCNKLSSLKMLTDILTLVEISSWNYIVIDSVLLHLGAKCSKPLLNYIHLKSPFKYK